MEQNSDPQIEPLNGGFLNTSLTTRAFGRVGIKNSMITDETWADMRADFKKHLQSHVLSIVNLEKTTGLFVRVYDLFMELLVAYKKRATFFQSKSVVKEVNKQIKNIYQKIQKLFKSVSKKDANALSVAATDLIDEESQSFELQPEVIIEIKREVGNFFGGLGLMIGGGFVLALASPTVKAAILETIGVTLGVVSSAAAILVGGALLVAGSYLLYKWWNGEK